MATLRYKNPTTQKWELVGDGYNTTDWGLLS